LELNFDLRSEGVGEIYDVFEVLKMGWRMGNLVSSGIQEGRTELEGCEEANNCLEHVNQSCMSASLLLRRGA
jgi:hypothetical protein